MSPEGDLKQAWIEIYIDSERRASQQIPLGPFDTASSILDDATQLFDSFELIPKRYWEEPTLPGMAG